MGHKPARNDPYQIVTDCILGHLERGVVPWHYPWNRASGCPRNFQTGRAYQGVNVLLLSLQRRPSRWWLTFRQTRERGGSVRKGEHGAIVIKWGTQKRSLKNGDGSEENKTVYFLKAYHVFNAVQIEGVEFPPETDIVHIDESQRIARADEIVAKMPDPPAIHEGRFTQAFYRYATDTIDMPPFARFRSPADFHLSRFHELVHSTGHEKRVGRKGITEGDGFRGKKYSFEELIAEMGAAFLGAEAGIDCDGQSQSSAYIKSWLDVLKAPDHRRWIVQAANQAAKAVDFILARGNDENPAVPVESQGEGETQERLFPTAS